MPAAMSTVQVGIGIIGLYIHRCSRLSMNTPNWKKYTTGLTALVTDMRGEWRAGVTPVKVWRKRV